MTRVGAARRRLALAWAGLVALTLLYLVVDETGGDGVQRASVAASVTGIGLALAKLRIIMRELMDVRHAPRVLRRLTDVLVVVMSACLVGTYLVGRALS